MFFQSTLLAGYAFAHLTLSGLGVRRHAWVHVALVAVALLVTVAAPLVTAAAPLAVPSFARPPADVPTAFWLALVLAAMVGLPFLALSSASPTTQRWFAAMPGGAEPYRLFAASNLGSLVGLVAYPTLVEPNLDLPDQARWWAVGFGLFAIGTVLLSALVWRGASARPSTGRGVDEPRPTAGRRATWLVLAAVPAALLIGITTDISTDVAAVPFLWIAPLTAYLATLILAYARPKPIGDRTGALALLPLALLVPLERLGVIELSIWPAIGLSLATLVAAGLALHGRLAADRPDPTHLTEYSLHVALGGALGGIAAGIVAPIAFRVPIEGFVVLAAAVLLVTRPGWEGVLSIPALVAIGVSVVAGYAGGPERVRVDRSFYGAYRVDEPRSGLHVLTSGTTVHGRQTFDGPLAGEPLSYYHRAGPLGEVIEALQADRPALRIGAVGLGAGAIAAYGRPTDTYDFIEIDQTVVDIARDPASFTYLADSASPIDVVVGDGRLALESVGSAAFDLLVLDAFSSDAVPVHLLTVESFATAMRTVAPGGVIAIHISNRFIDLEPVVAAAARDLGFVAIIGSDLPPPELADLADASQWVIVGRSFSDVAGLAEGDRWATAHANGRRAWTDRYSDLLGALRD